MPSSGPVLKFNGRIESAAAGGGKQALGLRDADDVGQALGLGRLDQVGQHPGFVQGQADKHPRGTPVHFVGFQRAAVCRLT